MTLRVRPFPAELAGVVSGWAQTDEEVLMWCGARSAPVTAEQISSWRREDGVEPFGLYRAGRLVAYGEYPAAGFEPAGPDQAAAWNLGQPLSYIWLSPPG